MVHFKSSSYHRIIWLFCSSLPEPIKGRRWRDRGHVSSARRSCPGPGSEQAKGAQCGQDVEEVLPSAVHRVQHNLLDCLHCLMLCLDSV